MNQKKKGNKAERFAAAIWNEWAKRSGKTWKYGRVPQSGALRWHKTTGTTGDITSTTEGHVLQFCIEVKSHAEIDFSQLLRPELKGVKILEFWKQCTDDAARAGRIPLLMCRYNGLPKGKFFIVMRVEDLNNLEMVVVDDNRIDPILICPNPGLGIFMSDGLLKLPYSKIHKAAKLINKKRNGKKD